MHVLCAVERVNAPPRQRESARMGRKITPPKHERGARLPKCGRQETRKATTKGATAPQGAAHVVGRATTGPVGTARWEGVTSRQFWQVSSRKRPKRYGSPSRNHTAPPRRAAYEVTEAGPNPLSPPPPEGITKGVPNALGQ